MGFKLQLEVDVDRNPDEVGEALRSSFFVEEVKKTRYGKYRAMGCYESFDWQPDVEVLPQLSLEEVHNHPAGSTADDLCWACDASDLKWTRGKKNGIECRWYWDGDGTLAFGLPDGRWLVNTDCKKSHGWYLVNSVQEI